MAHAISFKKEGAQLRPTNLAHTPGFGRHCEAVL